MSVAARLEFCGVSQHLVVVPTAYRGHCCSSNSTIYGAREVVLLAGVRVRSVAPVVILHVRRTGGRGVFAS